MSLNVKLLRESFEAIKPHALEVVEHFYSELFKTHPEARALFSKMANMEQQRLALAKSLTFIVENVENSAQLTDYLQKMGGRHVAYGTQSEHFEWVGSALLATLAYYFDAQWTDELRQTWTTAFTVIATEMKTGMAAVATPKKVIELKKEQVHDNSLADYAQKIAQELFRKSIEEEISSPAFQQILRKKVQELLRKALEIEATSMLTEARARAKSA